ncbi:MAG: hypothetical protein CM1200mP2_43260 [Planctomycetaceae bacterium]|nr:MAG: hypothetical protein CM1200mP2_43260 [Planctomycetaceae bacterium]
MDYLHPDAVSQRILKGDADLGIVSFPRAAGEFTVVPWLEQKMVIVLPPGHPPAPCNGSDGCRSPEVLAGEPFVGFCSDLRIRRQIDRWLKTAGFRLTWYMSLTIASTSSGPSRRGRVLRSFPNQRYEAKWPEDPWSLSTPAPLTGNARWDSFIAAIVN